jgi:hypothetical protein
MATSFVGVVVHQGAGAQNNFRTRTPRFFCKRLDEGECETIDIIVLRSGNKLGQTSIVYMFGKCILTIRIIAVDSRT